MRDCHSEIIHGVMDFGILIYRPQIGFGQTLQRSPFVDAPGSIFELFYVCGILIPLKVLELELLDSLSWVFVVGFVVAMVVVVSNWSAVGTYDERLNQLLSYLGTCHRWDSPSSPSFSRRS